jgi:carbamoyl-phosphate synthase large subunit
MRELGFKVVASKGTADFLAGQGVEVETIYKLNEGRPSLVDLIKSGQIQIIFNTPLGRESFYDERAMRESATQHGVLCVTILTAAAATAQAIRALRRRSLEVTSLGLGGALPEHLSRSFELAAPDVSRQFALEPR